MDPGFGLKVMIVEDHADIREALSAILEGEGYEVVAVESAEAGVARLVDQQFHLVVTDYCLPVKTGSWMVEEARNRGVLGDTKVLLITAHPSPHLPSGVRLMRKPLDVDDFVNEVGRLLASDREAALARFQTQVAQGPAAGRPEGAQRLALVLYISSASHSSLRALRNLRRLLERYDDKDVSLTVHDLSRAVVPDAEQDKIAFTPTLVRRHPGPRAWILGDLERADVLTDLLALAGVEEKR